MAKSRIAAALFTATLLVPAQGRAQSVSLVDPQALIEAQRTELTEGARIGCRRSADPEEIVVCGARENRRYRVVEIIEEGGVRPSWRAGGEQLDAMSNDRCFRLCLQPVVVSIIDTRSGNSVAGFAARTIERLREDD